MEAQQQSMKGMMLFMPLFSVYIGFIMPAALGIYWIAGSVLGIIQDAILNKHYKKILDVEDEERRKRLYAREEELERKRLETEKLREIGATERNKNTSKKKLQAAERAQQEERLAAEKARQRAQSDTQEDNGSQVGNRKYARGRAYVEDRFNSDEASYNDENGTETSQQAGDAGEDGDNA
jgi:YidC/Oxa1 family membrane protein insertase